ncbi:hypothetical protein F-M6_0336 [Faustovirus]|nr:hypothetical protein F-M6_0336 [Faustovirus]QJX73090.1 hypothetical protein F-VV57_0329 [Faustovirus]QJX73597.1 hypothetical protein F-VV63_0331 [Faustovirus]QJX74104.1 hypothetical protein F-E9_350 [Faustovirus]SMH63591.1 Hypothetical protein FSTVLC9_109 [Faustovirus]
MDEFKLKQRLSNLLPHCAVLLLHTAVINKINNQAYRYRDMTVFARDTQWFVDNDYCDLFINLYDAYCANEEARMPVVMYAFENLGINTPTNIATKYTIKAALLLLTRGYVNSKELFVAAVDANNLPLVEAIYHGGFATTQISPYDLPTGARLDYMERGLNIAYGDSLIQFLLAHGLLTEVQLGVEIYDPYEVFSAGPVYDNVDFHEHIIEHEDINHHGYTKLLKYT